MILEDAMRIPEPVIIRKIGPARYQATGRVEGCGPIRRVGRTEDQAKDRFFEACNSIALQGREGSGCAKAFLGMTGRAAGLFVSVS